MFVLFTDFGLAGPYIGQLKAALFKAAPTVPVMDLFSDAPAHNPYASAYLLAAYYLAMPDNAVYVTVVDPGVGGDRKALVVKVGGRYFVGPDNGLFELILRRTNETVECWEIIWRPEHLSSSFHGRDLFAPVAADLVSNQHILSDRARFTPLEISNIRYPEWPDHLPEIVYIDHYGNALTGIRSNHLKSNCILGFNGKKIAAAETFSGVARGDAFYYGNSNGLIEIAVNQGRASEHLDMKIGDKIDIISV